MKRTGGRNQFDEFSDWLSGLDDAATDIYRRVCLRIQKLEAKGRNPIYYKRIIDLRQERARSLWKKIDSITRSKRFSNKKADALFEILTVGIDLRLSAWRFSDDRRDPLAQKKSINEIGVLASKLFREITTAKSGYVSDFIRGWANESKMELNFDDFNLPGSRNGWAESTWGLQREMLRSSLGPQFLLFGLVTLSKAAKKYTPSPKRPPKSQIGLMSRKKSETSLFVIRLHVELERLFGKPFYGLNSDLSSLIFDKNISESRIMDIIDRARKRGEIRASKSKESPLS